MVFPYWSVRRGNQTRLLPLVPLKVHALRGQNDWVDLLALVDSGAEHNVLGGDLAERLGYSLTDGSPATLVGIGEQEIPGRILTVDLQLGKQRWSAPVIFAPELGHQAILGQAGFFAFFTVTFRHGMREIDIRRAKKAVEK
jgi:hypothetical protein